MYDITGQGMFILCINFSLSLYIYIPEFVKLRNQACTYPKWSKLCFILYVSFIVFFSLDVKKPV